MCETIYRHSPGVVGEKIQFNSIFNVSNQSKLL